MTEPSDPRLLLKQALLEIQRLRRDPPALRAPVAVIGLGCRFPGAAGPDAFWELLDSGREAIAEVPPGRWDPSPWYDPDPDAPGKISTRRGGFLETVDGFDADFFGLSPREAERMDPQQRLLLEVTWEALEQAHLPADRLRGSATGVFIGQCFDDYARLSTFSPDPRRMDGLAALGSARSVTAGRLAYLLDLKGPALCLDTACSSSLLAVHLAVQSLRAGQCRIALAGGVNLLLGPESFVGLSRLQALAPDGRCKSFDAAADGYGRGEGCGVVVLKGLAEAQADGDRVLAVIRGAAVNHDGASNGLTAPNGQAQEALLRAALADAGLGPTDIQYIEAHGAGTVLGDPIEALALARVLGEGRTGPLWLGSVKTNIGHLEAAAGVAGLIKTVLALGRATLPASLHFNTPNPHIPWQRLPLRVVDRSRPWPAAPGSRRAGVSAFGMSGTNVHVIIEEPPPVPAPAGEPVPTPYILPLSARDPAALRTLAAGYGSLLDGSDPADLCRAAATGRTHLELRSAVCAPDAAGLRAGLEALAAGRIAPQARTRPPRLAWLCTGQGAQYPGMGRGLYRSQPEFRAAIDRCAAILDPLLGRSLTGLLFEDNEAIHATAHTQPALFALEVALARTWQAWGVEPAVVMGHSVGQYVAACLAGVFSLEDGLRLIAERGRLIQSLPRDGGMAAVQAPAETLAGLLERHPQLAVAAINSPVNTVLSGALTALDAALAELDSQGLSYQRLNVSHAFHSPLLDPILEDFAQVAAHVGFHPPTLPLICNLSGEPAGAEVCDPDYWVRHLRRPVRFAAGVAALERLGCDTFLELGPRPTLAALGRQCLDRGLWLASLDPRREDRAVLLDSLGELYRRGQSVDWGGFYRHYGGRPVDLPTYPWQRRRYWLESSRGGLPSGRDSGHPLLGRRLDTGPLLFESRLDPRRPAWLGRHRVDGRPLLAAAAVLELLLAAGREVGKGAELAIAGLRLEKPIPLDGETTLQLALYPEADGWRAELYRLDGQWTRHAQARLAARDGQSPALNLAALRARCPKPLDLAQVHAALAAQGLDPPSGLEALWQGGGEVLARVRGGPGDWRLNPPLLDAAIGAAVAALPDSARSRTWRTAGLGRLSLWRSPGEAAWCHLRAAERDGALYLHLSLLDETGPLADLADLELRPVTGSVPLPGLYGLEWEPVPGIPPPPVFQLPVLDPDPALDAYAQALAGLEDLALDYTLAALAELGWMPAPGQRVTTAALAEGLGVIPRHRELFGRLLEILGEAGIARADGGGWRVLTPLPTPEFLQRAPAAGAEGELLERCGPRLASVLRGDQDPLELLFPGGDQSLLTRLYQDSPGARTMHALTARVLAAALPPGGRVLEVGAGTGATSAALLKALPEACEYWFTDLSPLFLNRARDRFQGDTRLHTAVLDLERDPAQQGFGRRRFHAVVAANVLHACRDLGAVLGHLRRLLAPGGWLLLVEGMARRRWLDITFGLTEGWWRFGDRELRPDHPLLPAAAWRELLESHGFEQTAALAPPAPPAFQQTLLLARRDADPGRWLLLADRGGVAAALARELGEAHCRLIQPGPETADPDAWRRVLEAGPLDGIVHLWSLDTPDHESLKAADLQALAARDCGGALHLVQGLLAGPQRPALWLVTRGARGLGGEARLSPIQAALWGLGETLQGEHPELACRLLDLDPAGAADEARQLARQLADPGEDRLAWRDGAWRAPRLVPLAPGPAVPLCVRADGRYAITGGLGGLGLALARWLAERGARQLLLIGRHADPDRPPPAVRELQARGVDVVLAAADVADPAALAKALDLDAGPPLRGVIHAAGVFADRRLAEHRWELFEQVFTPKLAGAWNLHRLTRSLELDFMVFCSSAAVLLGAPGLANYVAANAFLDSLARHRRRLGLPALAVDWSPWAGVGMAAAVGGRREGQWAALGLSPVEPERALAALERLLALDPEQAGVLDLDWGRFLAGFPEGPPALFSRLRPAPGAAPAADPAARLREAPPARRRALAESWVREQLAAILGFADPAAVPAERGFFQMGMDSLTAMDLHKRVQSLTGREPPSTLSFKYPTVTALGGWLAGELGPAPAAAAAVEPDAIAAELAELENLLGGAGNAS